MWKWKKCHRTLNSWIYWFIQSDFYEHDFLSGWEILTGHENCKHDHLKLLSDAKHGHEFRTVGVVISHRVINSATSPLGTRRWIDVESTSLTLIQHRFNVVFAVALMLTLWHPLTSRHLSCAETNWNLNSFNPLSTVVASHDIISMYVTHLFLNYKISRADVPVTSCPVHADSSDSSDNPHTACCGACPTLWCIYIFKRIKSDHTPH